MPQISRSFPVLAQKRNWLISCFYLLILPLGVVATDLNYQVYTGNHKWEKDILGNKDSGRATAYLSISGVVFADSDFHFWYGPDQLTATYSVDHDGGGNAEDSFVEVREGGPSGALIKRAPHNDRAIFDLFRPGSLSPGSLYIQLRAVVSGRDYQHGWVDKEAEIVILGGLDQTAPSFSLSASPNSDWKPGNIEASVVIQGAADTQSGVQEALYKVDEEDWVILTPDLFGVGTPSQSFGNGVHTIKVKLRDKVGNESAPQSVEFRVDTEVPTSPTIQSFLLNSLANAPGKTSSLTVSWSAASDGLSGLKSYLISTDSVGETAPTTSTEVGTETTSTTFSVPYNSDDPTKVHFWVAAKDQVGNISAWSHQTFEIPDPLKIASTPTVAHEENVRYTISVPFSVQYDDLKKYSKITLTRLDGLTGRPLPSHLTSTNLTFTPNGQGLGGRWSKGSGGYAVYTDEIEVSSGAGHRWIRYGVAAEVKDMPFSGNTSDQVALPNNKGWVEVTVLDSNGRVYSSSNKDPQFGKDATRIYTVKYTASDYDGDDWQYEIDRVTVKKTAEGEAIIKALLSGEHMVSYPYAGGYTTRTINVELIEGVNNLVLYWTEGTGQAPSMTFEFPIVSIKLDKQPIGGYFVFVTDLYGNNVPTDNAAIKTRPGEELAFSATPPAGSSGIYTWEFGDGAVHENSPTATHAYPQGKDQTSNKYTYTLKIHDGAKSISLAVEVYDTEDGDLLVDETWRGPHQVTGVVRVPPGKILTIAGGTTLSFHGSLGWQWNQGLRVDGNLVIEDGAVLKKLDGQDAGWGTIYVTGQATLGAAEIRDAKRGLTVVGPGRLNMAGTTVRNNATGIHLLGPVGATLNSVRFEGNTTYGLKEDAGARPRLTNSVFRNNRWNYYQWDYGILGIGEVNQLNGNAAGNREE